MRSWACGRISQPASMYCVATLKAFDGQFWGERIVFMVPCEGAGCQYVSASSREITTANGGAEVKAVMAGAYLTRSQLPTGDAGPDPRGAGRQLCDGEWCVPGVYRNGFPSLTIPGASGQ